MKPLLTVATLLSLYVAAPACPFCAKDARVPGVQRQLREHAIVALARCVTPPPFGNTLEATPADFEIVAVIQGETVDVGTRVTVEVSGMLEIGAQVLLLARSADLADSSVRRVSPDGFAFVAAVAALPAADDDADRIARLRFFVDHLGDPNRVVAASVLEEFSDAPYALIRALRPDLDAAHLARLIEDPDTPSAERGLLFLLYGTLADDSADDAVAVQLTDWLETPAQRMQPGLDGLLGAYLLVRGPAGLTPALTLIPTGDDPEDASQRRWYEQSLIAALDFHARYATVLPRPRILATLHTLLEDQAVAAEVIDTLRRLEAWDSRARVDAARTAFGTERPSVERAAAAFVAAAAAAPTGSR